MSASPTDPSLARLRTLAADAARDELGRLLLEEASPVLWRTIRAQLAELPPADQEEIHSNAMLGLTERLQAWLARDPETEIENLRAYAATTALNACRAHLRRRYPERTRLDNQLRYLLRHVPGLALWEGADGLRCGLEGWREQPPAEPPAAGGTPTATALGLERPASELELVELLRRLLLWRGAPWRFRELLAAVAELRGVRDQQPVSLTGDGEENGGIDLAEERPDAERQLADRQFLVLLWREVVELPRGQRVALLLNLRDSSGRDLLALLPISGVASRSEVARRLELSDPELAEIWDRLPLEDQAIAALLGLNQRQVINLRKSARERLGRRMRRHESPAGGRR